VSSTKQADMRLSKKIQLSMRNTAVTTKWQQVVREKCSESKLQQTEAQDKPKPAQNK
jgi:hypothetical protein